jgi:hypothetical protein
LEKKNEIMAVMQIGLQQGKTEIYDILEGMKFDDPDELIENVQKLIKEREIKAEAMAMQQQQMQAQQQMAMQQQQGQQQQQMQAQQIDADQIKQAAGMQQQKNQNQHDLLRETIGRAYEKPQEAVRTKSAQ